MSAGSELSSGQDQNPDPAPASTAPDIHPRAERLFPSYRVLPVSRIDDYRRPDAHSSPLLVRPDLSARETEVLLAWLAADSKEEVAATLFISSSTVSTHVARIRAKYAAVGRPAPTKTHLFARALQDGYTSLDRW